MTLNRINIGRASSMEVVPGADVVILINHHQEIIEVNLEEGTCLTIDRSTHHRLFECDISSDGRWIAYSCSLDPHRVGIKIYDRKEKTHHLVTEPILVDSSPSFDSEGKYMYFLSARVFDPVRDILDFGYSFPRGVVPMALPLQSVLLNPSDENPSSPCEADNKPAKKNGLEKDNSTVNPVIIEFDGILNRAVAMPVIDGRFTGIKAGEGRVWISEGPILGTRADRWPPEPYKGTRLDYWDLKTQSRESFAEGVYSFNLSRNRKVLLYRTADGLRVLDATTKPDKDAGTKTGRKSGWVDLNRLKAVIEPPAEWLQM